MLFKNMEVNALNIFYREAGKRIAPKLVLLHGFPASSHQYRNLIPALAGDFHVIAPDYPAFGNSDMPNPKTFAYTFDNTSEIIESFLEKMGFTRFGLYLQDYGGPVGFRIVTRRQDWLEWLIIQNTNAYEVGFTPVWDGLRGAYRTIGTWTCTISVDLMQGACSSISFTTTAPTWIFIQSGKPSSENGSHRRSSSGGKMTSSSRARAVSPI